MSDAFRLPVDAFRALAESERVIVSLEPDAGRIAHAELSTIDADLAPAREAARAASAEIVEQAEALPAWARRAVEAPMPAGPWLAMLVASGRLQPGQCSTVLLGEASIALAEELAQAVQTASRKATSAPVQPQAGDALAPPDTPVASSKGPSVKAVADLLRLRRKEIEHEAQADAARDRRSADEARQAGIAAGAAFEGAGPGKNLDELMRLGRIDDGGYEKATLRQAVGRARKLLRWEQAKPEGGKVADKGQSVDLLTRGAGREARLDGDTSSRKWCPACRITPAPRRGEACRCETDETLRGAHEMLGDEGIALARQCAIEEHEADIAERLARRGRSLPARR
jgi:hypothetical protein